MSVQHFNNDVIRVYIDLDGPLADFQRMMEFLDEPGSTTKLHKGVYRNLPVTHNAPEALAEIHGLHHGIVEPWILSKIPDENVGSASEKYEWISDHFGDLFGNRIILTPDKGCVGRPGDILIDDHPEWANAHKFPGYILKFVRICQTTNNWNSVLMDINSITREARRKAKLTDDDRIGYRLQTSYSNPMA